MTINVFKKELKIGFSGHIRTPLLHHFLDKIQACAIDFGTCLILDGCSLIKLEMEGLLQTQPTSIKA